MKSKNITNSCKNGLTSQQICEIIEICGVSGVLDLKFQDLHVTFAGRQCNEKEITHHSPGQVWQPENSDKKFLAQEEINLMDDQLSELQLINPLKYEELLSQQEL